MDPLCPEEAGWSVCADGRPFLYIGSGLMMGVSLAAIILRLFSRKLLKLKMYLDDWLILGAAPFAWALAGIQIYATIDLNYGRHIKFSTPTSLRLFYISFYAFDILYVAGLTIAKFSIIAFYWRIFNLQGLRLPLTITSILTGVWFITCTFVAIFICKPVYAFWDFSVPSTCINTLAFYIVQASFNILIDIALLAIAMIRFGNLQISRSQRIAIMVIFLLGGFTTFTSIMRLRKVAMTFTSKGPFNPTLDLVGTTIWSVIETNMAIVCASLPSMRPILRWVIHGSVEASGTIPGSCCGGNGCPKCSKSGGSRSSRASQGSRLSFIKSDTKGGFFGFKDAAPPALRTYPHDSSLSLGSNGSLDVPFPSRGGERQEKTRPSRETIVMERTHQHYQQSAIRKQHSFRRGSYLNDDWKNLELLNDTASRGYGDDLGMPKDNRI